jgi:Ras-related protein Rab-6A
MIEERISMTETEIVKVRHKICLLGDPYVGKTSLIRKYVYNKFYEGYLSTIGIEVTKKDLTLEIEDNMNNGNKNLNYDFCMTIWDIIGQKEFRVLISKFYKNASGALIISDLTREDTIQEIESWTSSIFNQIGKIPVIFVGNKIDLIDPKSFEPERLSELSTRYGAPWVLTSAKNGENVENVFIMLAKLIIQNSIYFKNMTSLIDVLDAIIVDFCEINDGLEVGMPLFREEFKKIPGSSLKTPTVKVIETAIDRLTAITRSKKGKEIADLQHNRFKRWLDRLN